MKSVQKDTGETHSKFESTSTLTKFDNKGFLAASLS